MFLVMFFHIRPFMTDNLPHVIFDLLGFIGCAEIIYILKSATIIQYTIKGRFMSR